MFNEIKHPDEILFCEDHNINESNNMDDEKCHININNIDKTDQMMNLHNIHTKISFMNSNDHGLGHCPTCLYEA
jgi:hypothetical protein